MAAGLLAAFADGLAVEVVEGAPVAAAFVLAPDADEGAAKVALGALCVFVVAWAGAATVA
jgi:hypothetical protein